MKNIIVRALIESDGAEIEAEHLYFLSTTAGPSPPTITAVSEVGADQVPLNLNEAEAYLVSRALERVNGNISEAARLLGVSRKRIYRKLENKR